MTNFNELQEETREIITDLLKEHGIVPDYTAGLSLGEYSALYCAGVFKRQQVKRFQIAIFLTRLAIETI